MSSPARVGRGQLEAAVEVGGGVRAGRPFGRHGQEARAAGAARPRGGRARASAASGGDEVDRAGQVRPGLGQRPAPAGPLGRVLVRDGGLVVPFRALEVRGEDVPVRRVVAGEEVAQPVVDLATPRGRLELVRDLPQELVAEPVAVRVATDRLEHPGVDQAGERRVQLEVRDRHRGRQQGAVDLLPGGRRRGGDRQRRRRRVEPGDERLVQRLRDGPGDRGRRGGTTRTGGPLGATRADELLEVQRDAAAAPREGRRSSSVRVASERVDQREAPRGRQRAQLDRLPGPGLLVARRREDEQAARPRARTRSATRAPRRVVEPVEVLGHEERRPAVGAQATT